MEIEVIYTGQQPDYGPLARHLLDRIIKFYEDPENEKAFRAWKEKRDAERAENNGA